MLHFPRLSTGIQSIDSQWGKLCRKVQAFIEHHPVTNAEGGDIIHGALLAASGDRSVQLTDASVDVETYCLGVAAQGAANTEQLVMTTSNVERIWMESGLVPISGQALYVSASRPGAATNVAPANPNFVGRIGLILDSTMYDDGVYEFVDAVIFRCCTPG